MFRWKTGSSELFWQVAFCPSEDGPLIGQTLDAWSGLKDAWGVGPDGWELDLWTSGPNGEVLGEELASGRA